MLFEVSDAIVTDEAMKVYRRWALMLYKGAMFLDFQWAVHD